MQTKNIGLKYLLQNQASPEITINEAFEKIDGEIFEVKKAGNQTQNNNLSLENYAKIEDLANNNYVINGNFDIWQRGTAFTSSGVGRYFADRWLGRRQDSSSTMQVSRINANLPSGSVFAMRVARQNGDTNQSSIGICQIFDSEIVQKLAGQNVTISAKIRLGSGFQNANNNLKMQAISSSVAEQGGSPFSFANKSVNLGSTESKSEKETWQNLQITIQIPINTKSLMITFLNETPNANALNNDFFDISQVKLEIGTKKTQFLPSDFATELAKCQYFYERINAFTSSSSIGIAFTDGTNIARMPFSYKQKRKVPSILASSQTAFNILRFGADTTTTAITFATITPFSARIDIITAGALTGGDAQIVNFANSTQFIEIDAEV